MIGMKKLSESLHREGRCPCNDCQERQRKAYHQRVQDRLIGEAWAEATFSF